MAFKEEEYHLPFFSDNGFVRKKCTICQTYFWTLQPNLENCGDAPCQPYSFLCNPPTKQTFTLSEMRESFLSFFEKNNHHRITPYPVIARWRDDLFVTIASIADFQPYVTEGVIPPPANPLVISQPCLRFTDIDNVGLTAGRHLTLFEMGGAHAFNYPDQEIYWKNETIRLHHAFVTGVLGVNSELVTYKEGAWSGGGNAGPCVEGCINGLEVSTLVFMQYKVVNHQLVEMPIKIVDTGYGIERFTWLSQGAPSGFHAIYTDILDKIFQFSSLQSIDEKIIVESTRFSALLNVETSSDKMALRKQVAERLNMSTLDVDVKMTAVESAYTIADHTKALVFMLAEGVVPSNVRVGYLTRLLLRRTIRLLQNLQIEDKLADIIQMQIDRWKLNFPRIGEMRHEILEALSIEEEKYRFTLKRGIALSQRIAADLDATGKKAIPLETLVELYDSHGITPETVKETVVTQGIHIQIPENFYSLVAQRHVTFPPNAKLRAEQEDLKHQIANLPPTQALYYDDPYGKEFDATILKILNNKYIVLDRTLFYPTSGGQRSDQGTMMKGNMSARATNITTTGNVILHAMEKMPFSEGQEIHGEIDWNRRLSLMRHHTSTHIILGAARKVIGQHVWQAGAEKQVDQSRLDITHWKRLTPTQTRRIEKLANDAVMANIPVETSWMQRGAAEMKYGHRLYQGGVVPGKQVRVVKIEGWDVETCAGTHLGTTGEVGFIKILHTERIQDGVERIVFASGSAAIMHVQQLELDLRRIAGTLKVPVDKAPSAVMEMSANLKKLTRETADFKVKQIESDLKSALDQAKAIDDISLATRVLYAIDPNTLIKIASSLLEDQPCVLLGLFTIDQSVNVIILAGKTVVNKGVNSGEIASEIAILLGGGGGGRPNFGQGGGTMTESIENALQALELIVRRQLRGGSNES